MQSSRVTDHTGDRDAVAGPASPAARSVVVAGGSAGGIPGLEQLVSTFPADLPAAVCVVVHFPADATSVLPQILTRAGALQAAHAEDGEPLCEGRIHVAPPDRHLRIAGGVLRLTREPRVHRNRPAIDPLFRSAGLWYRHRAIGVILSGNLDDGTAGLLALKRFGGAALVQDPADASHPDMPRNALRWVEADHVLQAAAMGPVVDRLARDLSARPAASASAPASAELVPDHPWPDPSGLFSCPDCGGVVRQYTADGMPHFECRVGDEYSPEALFAAQVEGVEQALWAAARALQEKAEVTGQLAQRFALSGDMRTADRYAERHRDARRQVQALLSLFGPGAEQAGRHSEFEAAD